MATCLQLEGDAYVSSNTIINLSTNHFTIEGWVRPLSSGVIFSNKCSNGGNNGGSTLPFGGITFSLSLNGVLSITEDNGLAFLEVQSVPVFPLYDGNWHHVAAMRTFPDLHLFVDGQAVQTTSHGTGSADSMKLSQSGPIGLGASAGYDSRNRLRTPGRYLSGQLTEVRFWRRPFMGVGLSLFRENMMLRLDKHLSQQSSVAALVALWPFSDGSTRELMTKDGGASSGSGLSFPSSSCPIDKDGPDATS